MKRILLAFGLTLALLIPFTPAHAEEGWSIDSFDARIVIEETGTVLITETIEVDFANLEKHGIYRDIPVTYARADGSFLYTKVDVLSVFQDSSTATFTSTTYNGYRQLKIGDANRTITGNHTYTITYRATGVLVSHETVDELSWNVTGNNWEVPISRASATITLPTEGTVQTSCYYGPAGATTRCTTTSTATTATFSHVAPLQPGEGMTVALGYTPGMVPLLTVDADQTRPFGGKTPVAALVAGFFSVLIIGGWAIWRKYYTHGRDSLLNGRRNNVVAPEYEPPLELRPAEVGCLLDERADTLDISATIVDLAVRGFLTITEIPKKGWFGSTDYQLTRMNVPTEDLREYEKLLLTSLFTDGESILTSSLTNTFYVHLDAVKEELYAEVTRKQLFTKNPEKVRKHWQMVGMVMFVVGGAMGIMSVIFSIGDLNANLMGFATGAGIGTSLLGIPTMILSRAMPSRTAKGREAFEKVRGYKMFLSATEKYRQPYFESQNFFMDVLPYAMVFGVTAKLANSFASMGIVPATPTWYMGAQAFNVATFSSNLTSFSKNINSSMASSPSSSGSGGGGSSGGGFGGGGGGSW